MNTKTKNSKKSTSLLLATAITFSSLVSVNTYASESSSELSLERIYGKDRYQTSIDILDKMDTNKVYLTNGKIFADALSVGPLAGKENAAIVLSDGKTLDVDKLKSKSITEITIVGGKNSISNTLENNLKKNFKVSRIAGKDRYETSLKIVEKMGVNNIAIATGKDFPDALSAGAYLSQKGMPLLLVDGSLAGNIPQKYNVVYTFGGVNSIKKTFGKRISGKDRYETSMQIAKEFGNFDTAVLASGRVFADALASTPLAKKLHAPILLTNGNDVSNEVFKFQGLKKVVLVGGEKSLSKELEKKLLNPNNTEESKEDNKNTNKTHNSNNQNSQNNIDNSKEVNIKDEILKKAIINQLKHQNIYKDGQKITEKKMSQLKGLDCNLNFTQSRRGGIKSLEGLEYAVNMTILDLTGNEVIDLTPLKKCKNLETLELDDQYLAKSEQNPTDKYLTDISPLKGLTKLKKLVLKNNKIENLSAIGSLTELEELDLYGNKGIKSINGFENLKKLKKLLLNRTGEITDISPLKECKDLEELSIQYNKVSSIEALKDHEKLTLLDISGNKQITDLSPLEKSTKLTRLLANGNKIESLDSLKNLTELKEIHVSENKIKDISPLKKLVNLEDLDIGNNPDIESLDVLKNLTNITELKINNAKKVKDFSPISKLKKLDDLTIIRSGLTDISFLRGLNEITEMNLQTNQISNINPLVDMANLREVKLGRNKIFDASPIGKLRSKFKVAVEMGSQEVDIVTTNSLVRNPIIDQSGNKLVIKEKEGKIKNNGENIEILNFDKLKNGETIEVKWGKDAEFNGSLFINIKKLKEVSSVKIENTETSLEKGKSLKLKATVEGKNLKDEDKKVKFEIEGKNSPNTSINNDGVLTIAGDETSTKITVKATSVLDKTKTTTKEIIVTSPAKNISTKLKMGSSKSIDIDKNNEDAKEWLKALGEGNATVLKGQEKLSKLPYNYGEKRPGYYAGEYGNSKSTGLVIFGLNDGDKVIVKVPGFEDVEVKVVNYSRPINYNLEIVQKNN
ncbi:cell wall-binding repeat-containing protein [Peptostreptococcus anaerobius]|nr:cell wall-binding repeat-containing protein [Peptostreptococcus anaerobius]